MSRLSTSTSKEKELLPSPVGSHVTFPTKHTSLPRKALATQAVRASLSAQRSGKIWLHIFGPANPQVQLETRLLPQRKPPAVNQFHFYV
ncbi:unnamed protein product [Gulo gulo]|uniref:Uncharacterized protein n=1 Tax=Gulo gulo TaxID=48420 RepID=A0A9X9MC28_GULGU|nr:unnamed protein product [Gulo gulo]